MKTTSLLLPRLMQTTSVDGQFAQSILEKYAFTRSAYLGRFALVFRDPETGDSAEGSEVNQNVYQLLMNVRFQLESLQHEESPFFVTKMQTLKKLEQVLVQQNQFLMGAARLQQETSLGRARRNERNQVIRERIVPQQTEQRVETTLARELFDRYGEMPTPELLQQIVRERVEQSMQVLRNETAVTAEVVEQEASRQDIVERGRVQVERGETPRQEPPVAKPRRAGSFVQLTDEFVQRLRQEGLVRPQAEDGQPVHPPRQEGYEDVSRPLLHRSKQQEMPSDEQERSRQELTRTVQEIVQQTKHEHLSEAVQQVIQHIRREDLTTSIHQVVQQISSQDLATTVQEVVARTKREDLSSAVQEIVERTKQEELSRAVQEIVERTKREDLSSAVQEIVERTKQEDLGSAVQEIVQRTKQDDLYTSLFEVVQRTRQKDLTRAVQEMVQRTQQEDLSSAIQEIVQRTKQESLTNAVLEIVQRTKQADLTIAVHEVVLRTGQEQLASAVHDIVLRTNEEHLTDALKEVVQRTKQQDLTNVMLEIVQHAKQENVTTALREMVQRTTFEDLKSVVHEITYLAQQDVLTHLVKEVVQRTQDELITSAKQQLVQRTRQEALSLTVQEVLLRIQREEVTSSSSLQEIIQSTHVQALLHVIQEILQRTEQDLLLAQIEQAVENSQSVAVTRAVQEVVQSTLQEQVVFAVQEAVQHTLRNTVSRTMDTTLHQTSRVQDANSTIIESKQSQSFHTEIHANESLRIVREWQEAIPNTSYLNSLLVIDETQQLLRPFSPFGLNNMLNPFNPLRPNNLLNPFNPFSRQLRATRLTFTHNTLRGLSERSFAQLTHDVLRRVQQINVLQPVNQLVEIGATSLASSTQDILQRFWHLHSLPLITQETLSRLTDAGTVLSTEPIYPRLAHTDFVHSSQVWLRGLREERFTSFVEELLQRVEQERVILTTQNVFQRIVLPSLDTLTQSERLLLNHESISSIWRPLEIAIQPITGTQTDGNGIRVLLHNTHSRLQIEKNSIHRLLQVLRQDRSPSSEPARTDRVRITQIHRVRETLQEQVEQTFNTLFERSFAIATTRQNQATRLVTRFIRRVTENTLFAEREILERVGRVATLMQTRILPAMTLSSHAYDSLPSQSGGAQDLRHPAGFTGHTTLLNEISQITNYFDHVVQQPGNALVAPTVPGTRIHHRFRRMMQAVDLLQTIGTALTLVPSQNTRHSMHHLVSNTVRAITNQVFHTNGVPLTYHTWLHQRVNVASETNLRQIHSIVQHSGHVLHKIGSLQAPTGTPATGDTSQVPLRPARRALSWQESSAPMEFRKQPKKAEEPKNETATTNVKQITLPEQVEKAAAPTTANLSPVDMERIVSKVYRELEEKLESEMKSRGF